MLELLLLVAYCRVESRVDEKDTGLRQHHFSMAELYLKNPQLKLTAKNIACRPLYQRQLHQASRFAALLSSDVQADHQHRIEDFRR